MIQLTRLNSKPLIVNSDLIKFVEQSPDTLVTLITGEKIVVLEKPEDVSVRVRCLPPRGTSGPVSQLGSIFARMPFRGIRQTAAMSRKR